MPFPGPGYALVRNLLPPTRIALLAVASGDALRRGVGNRSFLAEPWCAALAAEILVSSRLAEWLSPPLVAVQCTFFEKSAEVNWLVPMHRDLFVPVARRIDHPDLHGWSVKDGAQFVQAPATVLEQMTAVRVHLDVCGVDDGPLRVVPGSHVVSGQEVPETLPDRASTVLCCAEPGDALVMSPLLLHASSKSTGRSLRRVLHFLLGPPILPYGLRWQAVVAGSPPPPRDATTA